MQTPGDSEDRESWRAAVHGGAESDMTERLILNRDAIPDDLLGNSFKTFEQRFTSVKEGFLDILYCA